MAATGTPTPNIGLRIPQGTDPASVDDINYNSNLLDTKLGAVGNTSVQDQIDSLNSNLASLLNLYSTNAGIKSIVSTNSGVHMTYTGNTAFTMIVTNQNVCAHISKLGGGASPEIHYIYGQFNNYSTNATEAYLNTGGSVRTMIIFTTAQPSDINITAY